jgi:hypothetical protein
MVTNTQKTGNEEFTAILNNGTLVLPSYNNKPGEVDLKQYNYSFKNGNLVDPVSGKALNTVATAHTHPKGAAMGYDDWNLAKNHTPGKPVIALMLGNQEGMQGYVYGLIKEANKGYPVHMNITGKLDPLVSVKSITTPSAKGGKSLRSFIRKYLKK